MAKAKGRPLLLRAGVNLAAALLMGAGIALYYAVGLGADPNSVFMQGLAGLLGISAGAATSLFGCAVAGVFLVLNRRYIHVGTLIQAVFVGVGISLGGALWAAVLPGALGPAAGLGLCVCGALICGNALALYLACDIGASAVDMLILAAAAAMKKSFKWGYYLVYAIFMALGILLGGRWGVGTVAALLVTGPVTDFMMPRYRRLLERLDKKICPP